MALDVCRGLLYMHSKKVVHLDLKSANILLGRDGTAKIADVGLAKILTRDNTHVSMEGTFDWSAPEARKCLVILSHDMANSTVERVLRITMHVCMEGSPEPNPGSPAYPPTQNYKPYTLNLLIDTTKISGGAGAGGGGVQREGGHVVPRGGVVGDLHGRAAPPAPAPPAQASFLGSMSPYSSTQYSHEVAIFVKAADTATTSFIGIGLI